MIEPVSEQQQREAMAKMWQIFPVEQADPLHIRAIWGKGVPNALRPRNMTFTEADFPKVCERQRAFEEKALELNQAGFNIYMPMNRIRPTFSGNLRNGLAVKDSDIIARRYLLIDLDRSSTSAPATIDEINDVFALVGSIEHSFLASGWDEPMTVASGNGAHIYLPIELPNDDASKVLCQKILHGLAAMFDTDTVKVDRCVYNAGRIVKVPGTIARKGVESPNADGQDERFYRMASVVV